MPSAPISYDRLVTITQEQINKFAEATLDNQWIRRHERAEDRPFGAPIAHGYLTIHCRRTSSALVRSPASRWHQLRADKVRFPSPCGRVEGAGARRAARRQACAGGVQRRPASLEREGGDKPAAVVDTVSRTWRELAGGLLATRKVAIVTGAGRESAPRRPALPEAAPTSCWRHARKEQLDAVADDIRAIGRRALSSRAT